MADNPETDARQMKPWLKVVFVLSLALNLLVAGAVVTSLVKRGGHGGPHDRISHMGGPLSRALSLEERREIGVQMRQALRDGGAGRGQYRAHLVQMLEDLRAEPFDRQAIEAHMHWQLGFVTNRMEMGQGLLLDRLDRMSAEERNAFADRFEAELKLLGKRD
jgi:hypothetical protein